MTRIYIDAPYKLGILEVDRRQVAIEGPDMPSVVRAAQQSTILTVTMRSPAGKVRVIRSSPRRRDERLRASAVIRPCRPGLRDRLLGCIVETVIGDH